MGWIVHDAIIVTGHRVIEVEAAYQEARRIFSDVPPDEFHIGDIVGPLVFSGVNHYAHFLIAPDGSNEGWKTSACGERMRTAFVDWLEEHRDELHLTWVWVQYGETETKIVKEG